MRLTRCTFEFKNRTQIPSFLAPAFVLRTVFLWTGGLRRAQAGELLRCFWINDGGVSTLQVFSDANHVTVAVVQLPLGEEVLEL